MKLWNLRWAALVIILASLLYIQYGQLSEIPKIEEKVDFYQEQLAKEQQVKNQLSDKIEDHEQTIEQKNQELKKKDNQVQEIQKKLTETEQTKKELTNQVNQLQKKVQQTSYKTSAKTKASTYTLASASLKRSVENTEQNFTVTWYNGSGTTYSGRPTTDGVSISVDPNVIPLGSWVELTFPSGKVAKYRADDTGSAVKGRTIDIYKDAPTSELLDLGRVRNVKVRILD